MGSLRLPKIFYEQTAKWCSWHHEWHLRVFFLLCIHTPVTEKVLEFVQMEEYTSVFWSLWLNKHYWPTNKNDILIYFISCLQFNSCSERVWLCQLICTKSIPFLNYLKLLLPGILTLYLIAGCNFQMHLQQKYPQTNTSSNKINIPLHFLCNYSPNLDFGEKTDSKRHLTNLHKLPSPTNQQHNKQAVSNKSSNNNSHGKEQ